MNTQRIEALAATATGGIAWVLPSVADMDSWLKVVTTVLGLAWWIRLWIKNPNLPPPGPKA